MRSGSRLSVSSASQRNGARNATRGDSISRSSRRKVAVRPSRLRRSRQRYKLKSFSNVLTRPVSSSRHKVRIIGPGIALGAFARISANFAMLPTRSRLANSSRRCSIHQIRSLCSCPPRLTNQSSSAGSSRWRISQRASCRITSSQRLLCEPVSTRHIKGAKG